MPKRPLTLDTVQLALELMRRIPRGRYVSAPELHARLREAGMSRDLRTIQRLLGMLTRRYDIERDDRSRPYGYRWKERAQAFALPALTRQDSLLLVLVQQHLRNLLPAGLMNSMAGFFEQARANIDRFDAARERKWLGKVRVVSETQPLLPPSVDRLVFEEVSCALYDDRWLEVDYTNSCGKRIHADVMPLGLAQQGPRLYLVCRFEGFDDERTLALHRIDAARASIRTFQRPANFDLEKYDDDGRFGFGEGERTALTFRIAKPAGQHLLESPLSIDQRVADKGETYEIDATVVESEWLRRWLRGFGDQVTKVRRRRSQHAT